MCSFKFTAEKAGCEIVEYLREWWTEVRQLVLQKWIISDRKINSIVTKPTF